MVDTIAEDPGSLHGNLDGNLDPNRALQSHSNLWELAFPAMSFASWREQVEAELGRPVASALASQVVGVPGLRVQPLFCAHDLPSPEPAGLPDRPHAARTHAGANWSLTVEYRISELAPGLLAPAVERGVELLWLEVDRPAAALEWREVLSLPTAVFLAAGTQVAEVGAAVVAAAERQGVALTALRGGILGDPLGEAAVTGSAVSAATFARLADWVVWSAQHAPAWRSVLVSTSAYQEAGATIPQELAFGLATGVEYLRRLTGAGLPVDEVGRRFCLAFSVRQDIFTEIAKLRAARRLWAKVLCAWGAPDVPVHLHARTAVAMHTRYSPWNNLLRTTAASFAAVLGGADSLTALPHDVLQADCGDAGRRLAIQLQHILAEEVHLGQVERAPAGSYYLESLTDALARRAWDLFRELEQQGGMVACLERGDLAARIRAAALAQREALATRRQVILGVSEFADLDEPPTAPEQLTAAAPGASAAQPLPLERLAAPFEALRLAADRWSASTGGRPSVALLHLSPAAETRARAAFVRDFFALGGMLTRDLDESDPSVDPEATVLAWTQAQTPVVVLCATDDRYRQVVPAVGPALKAGGARVYLAGKPLPEHLQAGVDQFLFLGCDAVAVLRQALVDLGVLTP